MQQNALQDFIDNGLKDHIPHVSIDCAVFGFHDNVLKILLLKWKNLKGWSLPGGYMKRSEDAEQAAARLLLERTGLNHIFLQQYHTFTKLNRTKIPKFSMKDFEKSFGVRISPDNWLNDRVLSIGFYALVEYSKVVNPTADDFTEECAWKDIHDLPQLLFDHAEMVEMALKALRFQLTYQPVGLNLLPDKFTMNELQRLYETVLDSEMDRGNFRKKILALGIVKKTGERPTGKAHKTPHLYSFDKRQYANALKNGINFSL